jgi:hypothetical protein
MIRDHAVEQEAQQIAHEIWPHLNGRKPMPRIQSKQGGSSAAYYPWEHTIRVRTGTWKKLPLAGKRLLMIHELWHSIGHNHSGLYLHSFDILSLVVYERIYGRDAELEKLYEAVKAVADEGMKADRATVVSRI